MSSGVSREKEQLECTLRKKERENVRGKKRESLVNRLLVSYTLTSFYPTMLVFLKIPPSLVEGGECLSLIEVIVSEV